MLPGVALWNCTNTVCAMCLCRGTVFEFGTHGSLRFVPGMEIIVAKCHCSKHSDCRKERTIRSSNLKGSKTKGQGRPLGLLCEWLSEASRFSDQKSHVHDFRSTHARRLQAREALYNMPGGREFADLAERVQRPDEASEPDDIR